MNLLGAATDKGPGEREGGGAEVCVVLEAEGAEVEVLFACRGWGGEERFW